ncbi:uncharacterized protein RHOBADRAFT_40756 [Rhodotorula graminis WP1]|uniref:Uncharacterized protein n=1 Tax=Rhodotorula graminis (strain WP1) TaxID=578459 RepID=A0A194SC89_RHOGW|nr:uncharacterized protein RHOBADRAFT_40756 [Rhodotorula graminis WP1]KPV78214.1 hypothetical protein RHOBADRAFT_40756 [Rhodotorula graminis WP1]
MANVRFAAIPATNRLADLPIEALTRVFAAVLVDRVHDNDRLATKGAITRFHSKQPPPLEISAYVDRLCKYTPFPRDAVLLAVVYLNRITHLPYTAEPGVDPAPLLAVAPPRLPPRPPSAARRAVRSPPTSPTTATGGLSPPATLSPIEAPSPLPPSPTISSVDRPRVAPFLNSYTLHRLVLSVLLIATKFTADGTLSQTRAAKVGGVGANELCKLEGEGLRLLGWELGWSLDEIEGACVELEREAEKRGIVPCEAEERRAAVARRADEVRPPGTDPPAAAAFDAPALLPFASPPRPSFLTAPSHHAVRRPSLSTRSSGSTSTSATTTTASSSSEASTSQPSSSASSPQLFIALPHDVAGARRPHPHAHAHALPSRARAARTGSREGTVREGDELTPPSSPSASSVEGACDGVKALCGGEGGAGEDGVVQGVGALRLTARPEA